MANISDVIENFLTELFGDENSILISRNDLAQYFNCAPSQINYVLSTRFTVDKGYAVESKRGGGGYVTLIKLTDAEHYLSELVTNSLGDEVGYHRARQILDRLNADKLISERERDIMKTVLSDKAIVAFDKERKERVRAGLLKSFLVYLMKNPCGGEKQ